MEQMYRTYWIVVTWWLDRGGTWHVGWGRLILVTILLSLLTLLLVKVKIKYFWFVTWLHNLSVTRLYGWGFFILNNHPVKFGVHRPCGIRAIMSFICHVTTISKYTSLCWWSPLILSHHPAKFGIHRPCESGNIKFFICHVTTWLMCHVTL